MIRVKIDNGGWQLASEVEVMAVNVPVLLEPEGEEAEATLKTKFTDEGIVSDVLDPADDVAATASVTYQERAQAMLDLPVPDGAN